MDDGLKWRRELAEAEEEAREAEQAWLEAKDTAKERKKLFEAAVLKVRELAGPDAE